MKQIHNISVVIPVFNEKDTLRLLADRLLRVLKPFGKYEVIFVNDGSVDGTEDVLDNLCSEHPQLIKGIHLRTNCGKSAALDYGFKQASGELIAMIDGDLQDTPEEIPVLIKYLQDNKLDVVNGWRMVRRDIFLKTLSSRLFNQVVCMLSGLKIHDFNCGLKVMRRECLQNLKLYGQLHRFMIILLAKQGFRIAEHKVRHSPRKYGHSKYGSRRAYEGLMDLLTVIFITRYIQSPLYFFGFYGLLSFLAASIYTGFFLVLHLRSIFTYYPQGNLIEHPIWILGPAMFLVGVIFIFFGLMGELIYHISPAHLSQNRVKRQVGFEHE
ncbi:MAG: glycosyltransferase [Candidatus Omnitrophota bacterium]|nr:MAG: glycosyltransferase [Candidatus Omnitrophota bacterium]